MARSLRVWGEVGPGAAGRQGVRRPVSPAVLETAIHCVTADGRVLRGAECLRFVGCRLPLLAPLAALLWLPGTLPLAERVYAGISRHRYRWGRGAGATAVCETGAACPPRQEG